ncbi:MAG TPA: SHOCT domain-containing protein [Desulfuromonadales bacterium]|nr:SHOCT domain-containing protein [Desulfuromonadales bacterium]
MPSKGHITPGRLTLLQVKIGILVIALFLVFGLVFGFVSLQDIPPSETGERLVTICFFLIWVVVCTSMIVFYVRMLSKAGNAEDNSLIDFQIDGMSEGNASNHENGFADRLRQLEGLKRDGLITEVEYQDKRKQILGEKW